jgi:predicted dithiol-disulfide oxidoreductase (DUF899 family)
MTIAVKMQGEKDEYRKLRDELLEAEIALKDQRECVGALRRQLPMGPAVATDYVFREGPLTSRMSLPLISRTFACRNYLRQARIASSWIT